MEEYHDDPRKTAVLIILESIIKRGRVGMRIGADGKRETFLAAMSEEAMSHNAEVAAKALREMWDKSRKGTE